ncbi:COG5457 Uncharacterized conserved small protein [uncultured Caudovirales phage]|uniref:COG5457 Uncharacterized conserved small protein n=1 Tax=uncultured Caudovirales phage TaxID=2100421 RepID=A0A6J7WXI6_9CAUD|nr:COG5457 Uncharacterized conserved small protein [uncultured Caudovirales phage]
MTIIREFQKWLSELEQERRTRRELESLTDRDLHDIGISRCDIDRIAKDYMKKKAA